MTRKGKMKHRMHTNPFNYRALEYDGFSNPNF